MTSPYVIEQVARHSHQERLAAAAASRVARQARASRRQRATNPAAAATPTATVRVPRQRRWIDVVVSSVR